MFIVVLVFVAVVTIFFKYFPARKTVLIEGVLKNKLRDSDFFSGVGFTSYKFDDYCRSCFENPQKRNSMFSCQAGIPISAVKLNSFEPKEGDSIKIIVWRNIFGRIRFYKIVETNFGEETYEAQMRQHEAEELAYRDASDRRGALRKRMTIEDYKREMAEELKKVKEVWKRIDFGGFEKKTRDSKIPCMELDRLDLDSESLDLEYAETGTLEDEWSLNHLRRCEDCSKRLGKMRQWFLDSVLGGGCLSDEETANVVQTGKLSKERSKHLDSCYRCRIIFMRRKEKHLKNPPGSNCLTKEDRHIIHSEGEIPEEKRSHVANCERCEREADHQREIFIEHVIPLPVHPSNKRLKTFKRVYRTEKEDNVLAIK